MIEFLNRFMVQFFIFHDGISYRFMIQFPYNLIASFFKLTLTKIHVD